MTCKVSSLQSKIVYVQKELDQCPNDARAVQYLEAKLKFQIDELQFYRDQEVLVLQEQQKERQHFLSTIQQHQQGDSLLTDATTRKL
jgi:thymidine kinase